MIRAGKLLQRAHATWTLRPREPEHLQERPQARRDGVDGLLFLRDWQTFGLLSGRHVTHLVQKHLVLLVSRQPRVDHHHAPLVVRQPRALLAHQLVQHGRCREGRRPLVAARVAKPKPGQRVTHGLLLRVLLRLPLFHPGELRAQDGELPDVDLEQDAAGFQVANRLAEARLLLGLAHQSPAMKWAHDA